MAASSWQRRFNADQSVIGRQISLIEERPNGVDLRALTIVGVSTTVRQREIQGLEPDAVVYVPFFAGPDLGRNVSVIARTAGATAAAAPLIRQAVLELDPDGALGAAAKALLDRIK